MNSDQDIIVIGDEDAAHHQLQCRRRPGVDTGGCDFTLGDDGDSSGPSMQEQGRQRRRPMRRQRVTRHNGIGAGPAPATATADAHEGKGVLPEPSTYEQQLLEYRNHMAKRSSASGGRAMAHEQETRTPANAPARRRRKTSVGGGTSPEQWLCHRKPGVAVVKGAEEDEEELEWDGGQPTTPVAAPTHAPEPRRPRALGSRMAPQGACDAPCGGVSPRSGAAMQAALDAVAPAGGDTEGAGKRKRTRKAKEPVEKRGARYRSQPCKAVQERIARAMPGSAHRMFLIDRHRLPGAASGDGPAEEFAVLGVTGNVYNVTISKRPRCTCPDFCKRNGICKHILFVMLRVLRVAQTDSVLWQHALLTSEVERVLGSAAADAGGEGGEQGESQDLLASAGVRSAYRAAAVRPGSAERESRRRPVEGDCAICFEALVEGTEPLVWCLACGNSCHAACFARWESTKRARGQVVTCALCRALWQDGTKPAPALGAQGDGAYMNLAAQEARIGDTSLTRLYGRNAGFVQHHQGLLGIRDAVRMAQ